MVLSLAEPIAIGKRLTYATLPSLFKISFQVQGLMTPGPLRFANILYFEDANTKSWLVSLRLSSTNNLAVTYNNTGLTTIGPQIGPGVTSITLEVTDTQVKVGTSYHGDFTYPIPRIVHTEGSVYGIYASRPSYLSSNGTISNLAITGKHTGTIYMFSFVLFSLLFIRQFILISCLFLCSVYITSHCRSNHATLRGSYVLSLRSTDTAVGSGRLPNLLLSVHRTDGNDWIQHAAEAVGAAQVL